MTAISPIEGLEELAQTAYDLLAKDPKAAQKLLADGVQMLRDHQIELLSRPSPDPGVEAEDKANAGAGPKQLKFQSEFMARKHRIMAAAGANRCLGPDTLIDRPDGPSRKVSEICGEHEVWAWDGEKKVRAMAGEPFIKGYDLCYRIHLSNGRQVDCSANHRVLCVDGRWQPVGVLLQEFDACRQGTISDTCLSTRVQDDSHLSRKEASYQSNCGFSRRLCDALPRLGEDNDLDGSPSPGDVRGRISLFCGLSDDPATTPEYSPPRSVISHLSMLDDQPPHAGQFAASVFGGACISLKPFGGRNQVFRRPNRAFHLLSQPTGGFVLKATGAPHIVALSHDACIDVRLSVLHIPVPRQPTFGFGCNPQPNAGFVRQADSKPYLASPDGVVAIVACDSLGVKPIWDFEVPGYGNYVTQGVINHNSSKSTTVWHMSFCKWLRDKAKDGDLYWAIAGDFTKLRTGPHKWLWESLPRSMFGGKKVYTPDNGLGTNPLMVLTLPNGRGQCTICWKSEDQDLETFEQDMVTGVAWTEATRESVYYSLRPRIADTRGFILIDYIPGDEPWQDEQLDANPNVYFEHFIMADNSHNLPPGEIAEMIRTLPDDIVQNKVFGKSRASAGVVYKEFFDRPAPEGHLTPARRALADDWPAWVYLDVGKYTASLLLTVTPDMMMMVWDEVYTVEATVEQNVAEIFNMMARNGRHTVNEFRIDPAAFAFTSASKTSIGTQYQNHGLPVVPWPATQAYTGGEPGMIDLVRQRLKHRQLMVGENCTYLRKEFRLWRHRTDRDGKLDPRQRYTGPNHALDALKAWVTSEPTYEFGDLKIIDLDAEFQW